jgi:hypothetical protein
MFFTQNLLKLKTLIAPNVGSTVRERDSKVLGVESYDRMFMGNTGITSLLRFMKVY